MEQQTYPFQLIPLPYNYDAMEPFIDSETMYFHHDKHLKNYVEKLNRILKNYPAFHDWTLEQLLINYKTLPKEIVEDVLNNAGGVFNHNLFFDLIGVLSEDDKPQNLPIVAAIEKEFGSFEQFKKEFTNSALELFGSGYTWLVLTPNKHLAILNTSNQFTPLPFQLTPLLLLDLWEHSYYLKHQYQKENYIENWFHTINWNNVNNLFQKIV